MAISVPCACLKPNWLSAVELNYDRRINTSTGGNMFHVVART